MQMLIDISPEAMEDIKSDRASRCFLQNKILNGKLLTKNETICEEVKVTTADGKKITALLDKSRMLLWRGWITAELAEKALGWKMEGEDADSN